MIKTTKNDNNQSKIKQICGFLKIDFSFLILFCVSVWSKKTRLFFIYLIFCFLHEMSHFFVAKHYGYLPKKIHLSFFGASLEGYDDFFIKEEIKIVLAGPLFNFLMVCFCYLSFWFNPESYDFFYDILLANWSLFLFNMLPIFPLDCGRILLAIFNKNLSRYEAVKRVKKLSLYFVCFLFCVFLFSFFFSFDFSFGFVVVNLAFMCLSSAKDTSYKREVFVRKKYEKLKKGLVERNIYVKQNTPEYVLFKFIDDYHFVNFIFLDENFMEQSRIGEIDFYKKNGLL